MIDSLRDQLRLQTGFNGCPALLAITGASGAGKTTIVDLVTKQIAWSLLPTIHFDSLGVPTADEMTRCWESGRGWQKMMTYHWVYTARQLYRMRPLVILEGQFDPQYVIAACAAHRVRHRVVLLDIDEATRKQRLTARGQPELANDDMTKWAAQLKENAKTLGGTVVDAHREPQQIADAIGTIAIELLATVDQSR